MEFTAPKWVKYPKLLALAATFVFAYVVFSSARLLPLREFLAGTGYAGTFAAGIMLVYGFTAAPAIAMLLVLAKTQNIYIASFIAGFGALIGDLVIFRIVRHSFADEVEKLSKEWAVDKIRSGIPGPLMKYVVPAIGVLIIASPLPDEIGVAMLAASKNISAKLFSVLSFAFNTAGIFIILWFGGAM